MLWKGRNKYSILHIGKDVVSVMWMGAVKIYNSIRGYLFTSDKKTLKTSDGKILKPKQQS